MTNRIPVFDDERIYLGHIYRHDPIGAEAFSANDTDLGFFLDEHEAVVAVWHHYCRQRGFERRHSRDGVPLSETGNPEEISPP